MESIKQEVINHDTAFTFEVDDVTLNTTKPAAGWMSAEELFRKRTKAKFDIEDSSFRHSNTPLIHTPINGIIGALHQAYINHHPLKLSVSDFILMIGNGLGRHMEKHAEALRKEFVNFEGKQEIVVDLCIPNGDWSNVFGVFTDEIRRRVNTDFYDVIIDDTSVATKLTRIVSELNMMDVYKQYFDYCGFTCGFPKITLIGRAEDWELLRKKVYKLKELNGDNDRLLLGWWLEHLVPLVDRMVDQIVSKKIDKGFWQNMYKHRAKKGYDRSEYVSGWITVFHPYLADNRENNFVYQHAPQHLNLNLKIEEYPKYSEHNINDILSGISQVPFTWMKGLEKIELTLWGGYLGANYTEDGHIQPEYFYAVVHKNARNNYF